MPEQHSDGNSASTALGTRQVYYALFTTTHIHLIVSQLFSREAFRDRGPDVEVAQ